MLLVAYKVNYCIINHFTSEVLCVIYSIIWISEYFTHSFVTFPTQIYYHKFDGI